MNQYTFKKLNVVDLGIIDYLKAWELQKATLQLRIENELDDTLYLLEHFNTYTLGKVADRNNLICSNQYLTENKINVYEVDRGGDITYHGPGQLVGYPILDLKNWKKDTHEYLRAIESVIIKVCEYYGLEARRIKGLTGIWIENRKICAIGIKISHWVTMHGFAFNVNTDLSLFNGIIPCGIKDKSVTSLENELGEKIPLKQVKELTVKYFSQYFNYNEVNETYDLSFLKLKEIREE